VPGDALGRAGRLTAIRNPADEDDPSETGPQLLIGRSAQQGGAEDLRQQARGGHSVVFGRAGRSRRGTAEAGLGDDEVERATPVDVVGDDAGGVGPRRRLANGDRDPAVEVGGRGFQLVAPTAGDGDGVAGLDQVTGACQPQSGTCAADECASG